jgi:hypothetical protein
MESVTVSSVSSSTNVNHQFWRMGKDGGNDFWMAVQDGALGPLAPALHRGINPMFQMQDRAVTSERETSELQGWNWRVGNA